MLHPPKIFGKVGSSINISGSRFLISRDHLDLVARRLNSTLFLTLSSYAHLPFFYDLYANFGILRPRTAPYHKNVHIYTQY